MDEPTIIDYRRRRRVPEGLFAGRYVALGAVSAIVGTVGLLGNGLVFFAIIASLAGGRVAFHQVPFDAATLSLFGLLTSGLILVGSVGSFWRKGSSRQLLRAGLAGDLAVSSLSFVLALSRPSTAPELRWVFIALAARTAYLAFAYWAYSDIRADFYFKPAYIAGRAAVDVRGTIVPIERPARTAVATFHISGTDLSTGQPAQLQSRAATEALARKSAVAMGMDPASIVVVPA